ncbi:MAG: nuclear transport factor 2 family protein [Steroidobacteraceae bacterium]
MARLSSIAFAALAFWAVPAFARPPASERAAAAVMAVEHEWLAALQLHDVPTLARILGREFIDSDLQGDAITRAQYLGYFAHPVALRAPALQQSFEDTRVRFIAGGNVAIVTGVVISRLISSPHAVRHSRFTDVFTWRDARWQAVTGQETHFAPGKG